MGSYLQKFGFHETNADSDGLYNGLVLPPDQSRYLFELSFLSLASGIYCMEKGHWDLVAVPMGVWLTSINYWYKPDYSWRRYVDISYVHLSLTYQLYRSIQAEHRFSYWIVVGTAVTFYPLGCYFHKEKKSRWLGTICHRMAHIFGNLSNIILYSGTI